MVYSFYDPADADAGLGTYMILEHIAFARRIGLPHVYLGYWIDGSRKMAYKTRFKPQERLGPDRWERARPRMRDIPALVRVSSQFGIELFEHIGPFADCVSTSIFMRERSSSINVQSGVEAVAPSCPIDAIAESSSLVF